MRSVSMVFATRRNGSVSCNSHDQHFAIRCDLQPQKEFVFTSILHQVSQRIVYTYETKWFTCDFLLWVDLAWFTILNMVLCRLCHYNGNNHRLVSAHSKGRHDHHHHSFSYISKTLGNMFWYIVFYFIYYHVSQFYTELSR